jgi:hypothetical protein
MVDTEVRTVHASQIKVPFLSEKLKQEMYSKHKQDGEEWNVTALSKKYGTSIERTKAVLYLLKRREEFMKEKGFDTIPKEWYDLYSRYKALGDDADKPAATTATEEATATAAAAAASSDEGEEAGEGGDNNDDASTAEAAAPSNLRQLASEFGMSESKLKEVVEKMREHSFRQSQVDAYEAQMERNAEKLAARGVDTRFRETSSASSIQRSVTDDYYPELFDDDGAFEEARARLIEEIEKETKATTSADASDARPTFLRRGEQAAAADSLPADTENRANVPTDHMSRWKFAFKDLSKPRSAPTMIRTRRGEWRQANPLEEATRSWLKNPSPLDMEMYRDEIAKWTDPDGDEAEARLISQKKLQRRKAQKETAAAAAE